MSLKDRIGKFSIRQKVLWDTPEIVRPLLSHVAIIECTRNNSKYDYVAISELFDVVEYGEEVPFYYMSMNEDEEMIFVKEGFINEVNKNVRLERENGE